jgi:hypothetical protein
MPNDGTLDLNIDSAAPEQQKDQSQEIQRLMQRIDAMDAKNKQLLDEKKKFADIEGRLSSLPPGTDVQELFEFKQRTEQKQLESQGKYDEALTVKQQQFKEALEAKDKLIAGLEEKVRNLELINPAIAALSEVVHDPDLVLNNFIDPRKIKIEDGRPMVDDGGPLPVGIQDWARSKFSEERRYILKEQTPNGSGAPTARVNPGTSNLDPEVIKLFAEGRQDKQHDIYQQEGRERWMAYRRAAEQYKTR